MSYQPSPYEPPPASGQPYGGSYGGSSGGSYGGESYGAQPQYGQPYGEPQYGQPYGQPQYGQPYGQPQYGRPYAAPPGYPMPPAVKRTSPLTAVLITVGAVLAVCVGGTVIVAVAGGDSGAKPQAGAAVSTTPAKATTAGEKPAKPAEVPDAGAQFGLKLGTKATITGDGTAQNVTVKSLKSHRKACNQFLPDPDNGLFVVVDVLVEATTGTVPVNALNFKWVSKDGTTSDGIDGAFSGCDKHHLDATDLRPGQKRAGQVVFDVSSTKGTVEFAPNLFSSAVASWTT